MIDGQPIVLIRGAVPCIEIDITTAGELDVVQFQEHLVAEGFSDTHPITRSEYDLNEDRYVTDISTDEIKNWQESSAPLKPAELKKTRRFEPTDPSRFCKCPARTSGKWWHHRRKRNRRVVTARLETDLSELLRSAIR